MSSTFNYRKFLSKEGENNGVYLCWDLNSDKVICKDIKKIIVKNTYIKLKQLKQYLPYNESEYLNNPIDWIMYKKICDIPELNKLIVMIKEVREDDDNYGIVMEYDDNATDLWNMLQNRQSYNTICTIYNNILSIINILLVNGYFYCDIKSENFIINKTTKVITLIDLEGITPYEEKVMYYHNIKNQPQNNNIRFIKSTKIYNPTDNHYTAIQYMSRALGILLYELCFNVIPNVNNVIIENEMKEYIKQEDEDFNIYINNLLFNYKDITFDYIIKYNPMKLND